MERNFLKLIKDFEFEKEEKAFTPTGREKTVVVKQKFDYANIDREIYKKFIDYCRKYNAYPRDVIKIILYEEIGESNFYNFFNSYIKESNKNNPQNENFELRKDEILTLIGIAIKKCSASYKKNKIDFYELFNYVIVETALKFEKFDKTRGNITTFFNSEVNYNIRNFLQEENKSKYHKENYEQDGTYNFYSMNYANIDDLREEFGGLIPEFVSNDKQNKKPIDYITTLIDKEGREISIFDVIRTELLKDDDSYNKMLILYLHYCIESLYEEHQIPIKMLQLNKLSKAKKHNYEELADIYNMCKSNVGKIIKKMMLLLKDCITNHIKEIYELPKNYIPKENN